MATGSTAPQYFPGLESLRGIAALTVALGHVTWRSHFVRLGYFRNSALMVDFFFVLSGFVMFHSYGEKLRAFTDAKRFLIIRWGRLYPLHAAMLAVFLAIECGKWAALQFHLSTVASVPFTENTAGALIANLLLIHGLGIYPAPTWNVPSWSISVEFYTYALFALVLLAVPGRRLFVALCAALSAGGFLVMWFAAGELVDTGRFAFVRCILGFFAGVITYFVYSNLRERPLPHRILNWIPMALLPAVVVLFTLKSSATIDFLCVPLFMALVLAVALGESGGSRLLLAPALVWLGTVSYSIYLVHPAIAWCFETVLQHMLKLPRTDVYLTAAWIGDLLSALYVALLLIVSRWTFRHIEDRYRRMVKAAVRHESRPIEMHAG